MEDETNTGGTEGTVEQAIHELRITDADFANAAIRWRREFLMLPVQSIQDTLKYMTPVAGLRNKEKMPSIESNAQFAPYSAYRPSSGETEIKYRELETFFGNVRVDFEPDAHVRTIIGQSAATNGDGQANGDPAKMVIAAVMRSLGEHLDDSLFDAVRNPAGDTTKDLFNGWLTTLNAEKANLDEQAYRLYKDAEISSASVLDIAKDIERTCHPKLRKQEKFLFCSPEFADAYNDAYLLGHAAVPYNTQYEQAYVEGSNRKTTLVPLSQLAGKKQFILTPKLNILYGFDNMSDVEKIEVKRWQPWILTLAATMFFGTGFRTLDPRFLKLIEFESTTAFNTSNIVAAAEQEDEQEGEQGEGDNNS